MNTKAGRHSEKWHTIQYTFIGISCDFTLLVHNSFCDEAGWCRVGSGVEEGSYIRFVYEYCYCL